MQTDEVLARTGLAPAREVDGVIDVRTLGAIGVVRLDHPVDVAAASAAAAELGVAAPVPRPRPRDAALRLRGRRLTATDVAQAARAAARAVLTHALE